MGAGVDGGAIVVAVDLVVEVLKTGTDHVTLHHHSTEETHALVHRPNLLPATRIVALVRRQKIVYHIHQQFPDII